MEIVKSKRGGARPGAGRPKTAKTLLKEQKSQIDVDAMFRLLNRWAKGTKVICPHCMQDTGKRTGDAVALESVKELLNRSLGKSVQKSIDITASIELSADQIDMILERYQIPERALMVIDTEAVSVV